jgi:multicomponent Na+:H+ antiporter subunit G
VIGETIAFVGALIILVSAIGVLRFKDTLSRLHAVTKASTLGILLLFGGAAIVMPVANDWTSLILAMAFQTVTSPISGILISRSVYGELVARDRLSRQR